MDSSENAVLESNRDILRAANSPASLQRNTGYRSAESSEPPLSERLAEEFGYPILGEILLDPAVREACEVGDPTVSQSDTETVNAFESPVEAVMDRGGHLRRRSHVENNLVQDIPTPSGGG